MNKEPLPGPDRAKIDLDATAQFYAEKRQAKAEVGSNPIRIAFDELGNKYLLKTTTIYKYQNEPNATSRLSPEYVTEFIRSEGLQTTPEEMIQETEFRLKGEERACTLGKFLGATMPEAKFVRINQVPFISYNFLPDAKDAGYGSTVELSSDPDILKEQQFSLAMGSLVKILCDTGDDGQYLQQTSSGRLYLTDISLAYTRPTENLQELQKQSKDNFCFAPKSSVLEQQLEGIHDPRFNHALTLLLSLDESILRQIIFGPDFQPTPQDNQFIANLMIRKQTVVAFFKQAQEDPQTLKKSLLDHSLRD